MTGVGLSLDNHNGWWVWGLFVVLVIITVFVYDEMFGSHNYNSTAAWTEAVLVRNFGASWITTSLNWGMFVGFTYGVGFGLLAMLLNGFALFILAVLFE